MATMLHDGNTPFSGSDNVEHILSKDLLELSFKDRNDIQEEIHGVHCIAPKETPELIHSSLNELALALGSDDILPAHPKRGYKKGLEIQQRLQMETANKQLYVFGDDFRLRFLRLELFDVKKAARRILVFLDLLLDIFGSYALERPIRLSDFSEQEIEFVKRGFIQFMPFRDRSGRRIISYLPNDGYDFFTPLAKVTFSLILLRATDIGNRTTTSDSLKFCVLPFLQFMHHSSNLGQVILLHFMDGRT